MSEVVDKRPWWQRMTLTAAIAIAALGSGVIGATITQWLGFHDGIARISASVDTLTSRMDSLDRWRSAVDTQRADRYLELKLEIGSIGDKVDAIRQQQIDSAAAVRNTQADVQSLVRAIGAQPASNGRGRQP